MGMPSFQQLMLPALQTLGQRYEEISVAGLEDEVVKSLRISPQSLSENITRDCIAFAA